MEVVKTKIEDQSIINILKVEYYEDCINEYVRCINDKDKILYIIKSANVDHVIVNKLNKDDNTDIQFDIKDIERMLYRFRYNHGLKLYMYNLRTENCRIYEEDSDIIHSVYDIPITAINKYNADRKFNNKIKLLTNASNN